MKRNDSSGLNAFLRIPQIPNPNQVSHSVGWRFRTFKMKIFQIGNSKSQDMHDTKRDTILLNLTHCKFCRFAHLPGLKSETKIAIQCLQCLMVLLLNRKPSNLQRIFHSGLKDRKIWSRGRRKSIESKDVESKVN